MRTIRRLFAAALAAAALLPWGARAADADKFIVMASTTSTEQSGLFPHLLPEFTKATGISVRVVALGTGQALDMARRGDADVVFVHDQAAEENFVAEGWGLERRPVMYNDFVVVGPPGDPVRLRDAPTAVDAFKRIAAAPATFLSRGDESGTHQKEKEIWQRAGIAPAGNWYVSAGVGMGQLLQMADEKAAYALADRGTFLSYKAREHLAIVVADDPILFNPYAVTAVNPARYPAVRYLDAMALIAWLTSPEGQHAIAGFKVGGEILFHPAAVP